MIPARAIIYKNVSSENFNLKVAELSLSTSDPAGADIQLETVVMPRSARHYPSRVKQQESLKFSFSLHTMSPTGLTADEIVAIEGWLLSGRTFNQLIFVATGYEEKYFSAIITSATKIKLGSTCIGITCNVECDAPWAWEIERSEKYTSFGTGIRFYNISDNYDYMYPKLTIVTGNTGGTISIQNVTDNNSIFSFTGLSANETLSIDNEIGFITSSTGLNRVENFNKKYFRLGHGQNNMAVTGDVASLTITYQNARKIGV